MRRLNGDGRPRLRLSRLAVPLGICLFALSACAVEFGGNPYDDYSKPGVSRKATRAAANRCEQRVTQMGGAAANRNASMRSGQIDNCLRRQGYSKHRRRGRSGEGR